MIPTVGGGSVQGVAGKGEREGEGGERGERDGAGKGGRGGANEVLTFLSLMTTRPSYVCEREKAWTEVIVVSLLRDEGEKGWRAGLCWAGPPPSA